MGVLLAQDTDLLPYKREVEVSFVHGANQANCTEKHRRQTIGNGERKGQPDEEPYSRKSGQEGSVGVLL